MYLKKNAANQYTMAIEYHKNPVKRDGVSQKKRRLPALDPAFVKIDERTVADFLVFARAFSRQVVYFGLDNRPDGDWQYFFDCAPATLIAAIEKTSPLPNKEAFLAAKQAAATPISLAACIDQTLLLARKTDSWILALPQDTPLRSFLLRLVEANLGSLLGRLAGFEKSALVRYPQDYPPLQSVKYAGFSPVWRAPDLLTAKPDPGLFILLDDDTPTEQERLNAAQRQVEELFTQVYNVFFQVIQSAPAYFDNSLLTRDNPPHFSLFIAFLKLYLEVQADLNRLTERHLDFFYRDALQLEARAAVPDQVHLFFELAKTIPEHRLTLPARFKAGKDKSGKELFYTLNQEDVLNRATVDSLRTIYVYYNRDDYPGVRQVLTLHAAPVANSGDGSGGDFIDPDLPSWAALGDQNQPKAQLGFAVASNELLLAEGKRKVTLSILTDSAVSQDIFTNQFDIYLSGEKKWLETADLTEVGVAPLDSQNGLEIKFTIGADKPAVTPFNPAVLKEELGTTLPVLKVLLHQPGPGEPYAYETLKNLKINSISLNITVSEARSLLAFNDQGPVDPSKTFLPFGSAPKTGSRFFVGSQEAFRKSLDEVTLSIGWEDVPTDFALRYRAYGDGAPTASDNFTFKSFILKSSVTNGESSVSPKSNLLFGSEWTIKNTELAKAIQEQELDNYGLNPAVGFLRFELQRDFEHDLFSNVLTRQMLAASKLQVSVQGAYYLKSDNTVVAAPDNTSAAPGAIIIPKEPYTPAIKSLTLTYTSVADTVSDPGALLFLHVQPFAGCYEHFKEAAGKPVLPQFPDEGALFIGLRDLKPRQSLSLLIQVAENTANADSEEAKVDWYYLVDNVWAKFEGYEIARDTTQGLITSGIVTFSIPPGITDNNTILPAGLHWLKASAPLYSDAVCELIAIHAQAVSATFQDNANDPVHLQAPLPAGTIGKMEFPDAEIKSLNQPYDSFGGRPAEEAAAFYTRISERLRHKGRAITLFDYERLVLEQFPDIYKVKCINHTNENDQLRPGNVLISVIPDYSKLKAVDRREPKVTKAKLEAIKSFLEQRNSAFVCEAFTTLHVLNPVFENITVDFKVRFRPNVTAVDFYLQELKKAITHFLTPWAFDDGAEINFGGKVYQSSILNFVEEQPYVDFVTEFKMMRLGSDDSVPEIEGRTQRSILVAAPIEFMTIGHLDQQPYCTAEHPHTEDGYEYSTLGKDLQIQSP